MMPQDAGRNRPKGPPLFAERDQRRLVGPCVEPFHLMGRYRKGEILRRPDIGALQRRQQIDVGSPSPDAGDRRQPGGDFPIAQPVQPIQIEFAVGHHIPQRTNVTGLLAAEPGGAQIVVALGENLPGRDIADQRAEPVKGCHRRGKRHLLFQDKQHQRCEAGRAGMDFRRAEGIEDCGEIGILAGQFRERGLVLFWGKHGGHIPNINHVWHRWLTMAKRSPKNSVTRFAPSPTGYLHLGHAYSALTAAAASGKGGKFHLRIEDIDPTRSRTEFDDAIQEDLAWLGLKWEKPVIRQSARMDAYHDALKKLERKGIVYPCFCTRADIKAEIERSGTAPHGPDGPVYPGACRDLDPEKSQKRIDKGESHAIRLDMMRAAAIAGPLSFQDVSHGTVKAQPEKFGDIVLARKETPTSYHLAVTVDDHEQGVTLVTRGADLFEATHVHRLLQKLLGLDTPKYNHHRLLTDDAGRRLAKRDGDITIRGLRDEHYTPDEVRAMTGFEG
jgi:glutamyl-Q tRNA(Asp) synthetase